MELVWFIVLVGVLIFVHELGHFAWAKFFGVRVLKFSLGFGPKLVGFRRGGTEYVIAAFPLGGYVRMLGETPREDGSEVETKDSFATQVVWKRMIIVIAGPAMNLLFPLALYFVVALGDTMLTPPVIGRVFPNRPADGKLLPGDRVLSIDGDPVETFDDMVRYVNAHVDRPLHFEVQRGDQTLERVITPVLDYDRNELDVVEEVGRIGVRPNHPLAVIGVLSPASPAAAARLETFDVVVAAAGKPITRWIDLVHALDGSRGGLVPVTYLRPLRVQLGGLAELEIYEPRIATVTPEPGRGSGGLGRAGIELADLYVSEVRRGSPEERIGLAAGDRLLTLDGQPIRLWETFLADLEAGRGRAHVLTWRRQGREMTANFRLAHETGINEFGQRFDRYAVGVNHWLPMRVDPPVPNPRPIRYAIREAFRSTWDVMKLTSYTIVRLLQGRLTVKSIGGPLTIFEVAGRAARQGALNYLTLMAFISINLGLINLLPIPTLDGGHALFFVLETIAQRPVSLKVRQGASLAGLALLLLLMVLAFKNDLERQWPLIMDAITSSS